MKRTINCGKTSIKKKISEIDVLKADTKGLSSTNQIYRLRLRHHLPRLHFKALLPPSFSS